MTIGIDRRCVTWLLLALTGCSQGADGSRGGSRPVGGEPALRVDPEPVMEFACEPTRLVDVPGGSYRPLFPGKGVVDENGIERTRAGEQPAEPIAVAAFRLEEHAVTNRQFLAFVAENPEWRRSQVKELFVDRGYLAHWAGDLEPGEGLDDRPVTNVSWFAARAYAHWRGRRLPMLAEWESVGAASETQAYGREDEMFVRRILDWYSRPIPRVLDPVRSTFENCHGVWDMHGLVWEWIEDFNSALVTGESRGDSGLERKLFCGSGSVGAADPSDYAAFMRFAFRSSLKASYVGRNLGFRCAADAATEDGGKR